MKLLFSLLMMVGASCAVHAQAPQIDRVDIRTAGLVELSSEKRVKDPTSQFGFRIEASTAHVKQATTRIPAALGSVFGLSYTVVGRPKNAVVNLRSVIVFPRAGLRNPDTGKTLLRDEETVGIKIGSERTEFFLLDKQWEAVPGDWAFQIWDGSRMLAEQKFTLYRP